MVYFLLLSVTIVFWAFSHILLFFKYFDVEIFIICLVFLIVLTDNAINLLHIKFVCISEYYLGSYFWKWNYSDLGSLAI